MRDEASAGFLKRMEPIDYWHTKTPMPDEAKKEAKAMVRGTAAFVIRPADSDPVRLLKVEGEVFAKVFSFNRDYLFHGDFTALAEEHNYTRDDCYLTEDGLAGFCITERNWLVSVFSNEPWRGFLEKIAPHLVKATKLVCIVTEENRSLVEAYQKTLGFRIIAETIDDTAVMTEFYGDAIMDSFVQSNGRPHHVFLYRPLSDDDVRPVVTIDGYFEAERHVDEAVE